MIYNLDYKRFNSIKDDEIYWYQDTSQEKGDVVNLCVARNDKDLFLYEKCVEIAHGDSVFKKQKGSLATLKVFLERYNEDYSFVFIGKDRKHYEKLFRQFLSENLFSVWNDLDAIPHSAWKNIYEVKLSDYRAKLIRGAELELWAIRKVFKNINLYDQELNRIKNIVEEIYNYQRLKRLKEEENKTFANTDFYFGGIYEIINKVTQERYIGKSKNIKSRWSSHKTELRSGRHHCKNLQKSYDEYGEENFVYNVIEVVKEESERAFKERYWLDNAIGDKFNGTNAMLNWFEYEKTLLNNKIKELEKELELVKMRDVTYA